MKANLKKISDMAKVFLSGMTVQPMRAYGKKVNKLINPASKRVSLPKL